ncbi:MAG: hypothetical protein QM750_00705 [Rubrivivax sp.]
MPTCAPPRWSARSALRTWASGSACKPSNYQRRRLEASYADFLADRRHAQAVRFFIDELHGPTDLAGRETQIAAFVPVLARSFPPGLVDTVAALAAWHALSESLDVGMGRHLAAGAIGPRRYATAWRASNRAAGRQRQVALMLRIGSQIDRHVRDPLLMGTLRMMRGPAMLAGLGSLHRFLESGFDAFASMRGAGRLLAAMEQRETALCAALCDDDRQALADWLPTSRRPFAAKSRSKASP